MSSKIDIYEYRDYLQQRYGEILYRVPIDTGGNCPHRNIDGTGGCTFCPEDGARAVQLGQVEDSLDQANDAEHHGVDALRRGLPETFDGGLGKLLLGARGENRQKAQQSLSSLV